MYNLRDVLGCRTRLDCKVKTQSFAQFQQDYTSQSIRIVFVCIRNKLNVIISLLARLSDNKSPQVSKTLLQYSC